MNVGLILVVWVLGGHFVQFANNGNLFLDGSLNLGHERRIWHEISATRYKVRGGGGRELTALAGRGVDAGEKGLGVGDGALEALHDLGEGVADLGLLVEFVLEVLEDGGVEEAGVGVGRHGGWLMG